MNLVPTNATDSGFILMLPNAIDDAEQRLYRELDLVNTQVIDTSGVLTAGTRTLTLPTSLGIFLVVDEINVITPAGTSNPNLGTRNPLTPATKEMIDFLYPSANYSTVPLYFAPISQGVYSIGPFPDHNYSFETIGTQRPAPLSVSNQTTLLSVYFPDLLIAASMVFVAGYMKNYGQAVDDPQQGVSWETHLKNLLGSAQTEEQRKKFNMAGWSSKQPAPQATPPRN